MSNRTLLAGCTCAALAMLAVPATAAAAVIGGGVSDPQTDVHTPQLNILSGAAVYDPSGVVRAGVRTAAPATEATTAVIKVMLGKASPARGTCDVKFDGAMYPDDEGAYGGLSMGRRDLGLQKVDQVGTLMTFDTAAGDGFDGPRGALPALAAKPWDCGVIATLSPKLVRGDYALVDDSGVFPLTPPRADGVSPVCRIGSEKVRRGGRLRMSCIAVTGKVIVRLHRKRARSARKTTVAADGHASVKVRRRIHRGGYVAAVWQGKTLMGSRWVRVR